MAELMLRMLKALGSDTNASNSDDGGVDERNWNDTTAWLDWQFTYGDATGT